jgi:hypothetical protein
MIYSISFLLQENHQHQTIKTPSAIPKLKISPEKRTIDGSDSIRITKTIPSLDRNLKTLIERPQLLRTFSGADDLEMLKEIGGTGTAIDPVTHHQRISAFAREFNSSRYEV